MNSLTDESVLDDENIKFVEDKLEYAEKMKAIEEELDCSLEAVAKLRQQQYFFLNGYKYKILHIVFEIDTKPYIEYYFRKDYLKFELVKNHKKTWFLKEDRSE